MKNGYSVEELAQLLGVSASLVKSILRGKHTKVALLVGKDFVTAGARPRYIILPSGVKKMFRWLGTSPSLLQDFLTRRELGRKEQAKLDAQLIELLGDKHST